MKKLNLLSLIITFSVLLSACGGGDSTSPNQSPNPTPIVIVKKTINVDNLEQVFSSFLLYRYRLTKEIDLLSKFSGTIPVSSARFAPCPLGGSVDRFATVTFYYCYTDQGVMNSGSITWNPPGYGPTRNNWYDFVDLNYQLSDDTEVQLLSGIYHPLTSTLFNTVDLRRFNVEYTRGARTETYNNYAEWPRIVEITTFDGVASQNFKLTEYDDKSLPVTPVISAADGSNISIEFSSNGSANLSLRNDKDGVAHATKNFTQAEIDRLLVKERKSKT